MSATNTHQPGEVSIEIPPPLDPCGADDKIAARVDTVLRYTALIARALTGAEQAALKLWIDADATKVWKYYSLSEKYASYQDFRVDARGVGLHGMPIPPGEVVRLTQDQVASHPQWRNFGAVAPEHPPMRGWLASSVSREDGRVYGLLQLSDKSGGRDFNVDDERRVRELAALLGETLDAIRAASSIP
jgi:GAF domain-containing protein